MKKINTSIIISIFIFLIILLLSISIVMANNADNIINHEINKEKIYHEIKYFDSQIIYMTNLLNNVMNDRNFYIDWEELQNQNKILYNYWNSVILDLNYLNIPKNDLTDFSKILDELNISIRYNNKNATLSNLLKLFNKLVIYSKELNYNNYSTILFSKYNLLLAYSVAESGNWTLTHDYILKSSEYIYKLINSMEINHYSQYNINQTYVAIKELENLINIRDLQTFYIKYIIAIKKLENI